MLTETGVPSCGPFALNARALAPAVFGTWAVIVKVLQDLQNWLAAAETVLDTSTVAPSLGQLGMSCTIDLCNDDEYEQDLEKAIAASLAGSIVDNNADEDQELQTALQLSMCSYEAEQQARPQHSSRKRSCSSSPVTQLPPAGAAQDHTIITPAKRQRRSSVPAHTGVKPGSNSSDDAAGVAAAAAAGGDPTDLAAAQELVVLAQRTATADNCHDSISTKDGSTAGAAGLLSSSLQASKPVVANRAAERGLLHRAHVQNLQALAGTAPVAEPQISSCDNEDNWNESACPSSSVAALGGVVADNMAILAFNNSDDEVQQTVLQPQEQQQAVSRQWQQQHERESFTDKQSAVAEHRVFYSTQAVWWKDPATRWCFQGRVMSFDVQQDQQQQYLIELSNSAVKYVEAAPKQLHPYLYIGEHVWCRPSLAIPNQRSKRGPGQQEEQQPTQCKLQVAQQSVQPQQQQQQHQPSGKAATAGNETPGSSDTAVAAGQVTAVPSAETPATAAIIAATEAARDPLAPWVLGRVLQAQLTSCTPVVEVELAGGDCYWFPVCHVQLVKEIGESSKTAERRLQQLDTQQAKKQWTEGGVEDAGIVNVQDQVNTTVQVKQQQQQQGKVEQPQQAVELQQQQQHLQLAEHVGHTGQDASKPPGAHDMQMHAAVVAAAAIPAVEEVMDETPAEQADMEGMGDSGEPHAAPGKLQKHRQQQLG